MIKLEGLSIEEINLILTGLGKLPFEDVNELIIKLQNQAQAQIAKANGQPEPQPEATPPG